VKKRLLAWSHAANGSPAYSTASTTLGGSKLQEGTGSAKDKLERRSQEGFARMGLTWEEAEVAAFDRLEWSRCVAKYVSMDVG